MQKRMHNLLVAIREKPGMYLGSKTVTGLFLFLFGIRFAEEIYQVPQSNQLEGYVGEAFEEWVASQFNHDRLSKNSFYLAAHLTGSESEGFDLWFEWYNTYVVKHGK